MNDLRVILDRLDGQRIDYVYARSKASSAKEALEQVGISRSTYYTWEDREQLEELANEIRRNRVLVAEPKLNAAVELAVDTVVELLGAESEQVRLGAAKEIMNRVLGQVKSKVDMDVTSNGETVLNADILNQIMRQMDGTNDGDASD